MRLLVDGDACPVLKQIQELADCYHIDMTVYVDYAHQLSDDYHVEYVDIGNDSADQKIVSDCQSGDVVITQDYGLASLLLLKGVWVLHVSGKMISEENIQNLLLSRYLSQKERQKRKHVKGPRKRTQKDNDLFLRQLEKIFIHERFKKEEDFKV